MRERAARAAPARRARALARRAQGDRAAQPPRLVELPHLPLVREGVGVPAAATSRSCCTARERRARLPPLRPPRARARRAATPAARSSVARHGAGTERVEAELRGALDVPGLPPRRRHRADKDAVAELLGALPRRADAACCSAPRWSPRATTSPTSTLGVVLDADATLRFPDFRAEERTFALIAQLAGRAGRGPRGGRVLVQTLAPDAPRDRRRRPPRRRRLPRRRARRRREALRYPPFADLIRVVCSRRASPARARRGGRASPGDRRRGRRAARPGAAVPPARPRALPARASRPTERARRDRAPSARAVRGRRRATSAPRGVSFSRGRRPAVADSARAMAETRSQTEAHERGRQEPARAARSRGPRAPRGGARARAQVRRPGAARRARCAVERFDDALREEVERMGALMHDALGIGLAATQVGVMHRAARLPRRARRPGRARSSTRCSSGRARTRRSLEEGCLSPARRRASRSSGRCTCACARSDERGEPILVEASGLEARVIQHEMDHLDGVLILDRTLARPAQGGDARAARGARAAPAAADVRTVYLGTSEFAAAVLERLADAAHRPRSSSPGPTAQQGRGQQARAAAGRRCRARELGHRARSSPRTLHDAGDARARSPPPSPTSLVVCAFGALIKEPLLSRLRDAQRPPVAAAALARRGADRAGDHGRRRARPASRSCA